MFCNVPHNLFNAFMSFIMIFMSDIISEQF